MRAQEAPVVVVCGDVGGAPAPIRVGELVLRLRRELPGTVVVVVPGVCEGPRALGDALSPLRPARVVLGCRAASERRGELLAALRRAGVTAAGTDIVDLRPSAACAEKAGGAEANPGQANPGQAIPGRLVLEQSIALLSAGVARVIDADLEAPVRERTRLSVGGVSRRSLLRGVSGARHPIVVWRPGRCKGGVACTACVLACPHGALHRDAGGLVVDGDYCQGCGACVTACRSGAFALPGAGLDGLGAAARVLVESIGQRRSATGVALACQHSKTGPRLGEQWFVLRVPSLEMVTAGWLLQLASAGVSARVVACEDGNCQKRAGDLASFLGQLAEVLGFMLESPFGAGDLLVQSPVPPVVPGRPLPPGVAGRRSPPEATGRSGAAKGVQAAGGVRIELREPEATMQALAVLGALEPARARWRADGPGCSLGMVGIDAAGCSLCEVCVTVCPTGALEADRTGGRSLRLSFDPSRCTACEACVAACPERVVTLERAVDSAVMTAGRRVVATGPTATCEVCGAPLGARLPAAALRRLGGSHPLLTGRTTSNICADCRLGGRSVRSKPIR
ncbi:MAG: 4Fe-4S binding protein [Acidimicrobiales bacterium]|jgi:ferredoxin